jgi:hypothetical protein
VVGVDGGRSEQLEPAGLLEAGDLQPSRITGERIVRLQLVDRDCAGFAHLDRLGSHIGGEPVVGVHEHLDVVPRRYVAQMQDPLDGLGPAPIRRGPHPITRSRRRTLVG